MFTPTMGSDNVTPMTPDMLAAYAYVQNRLSRATSSYLIERYERTLNELIQHPYRVGQPTKLVNAAYGNAGKVIRSHARRVSDLTDYHHDIQDNGAELGFLEVEFQNLIDQHFNSVRERSVAYLLLHGHDPSEIANAIGITANYAHVLISRIRKQVRAAWELG